MLTWWFSFGEAHQASSERRKKKPKKPATIWKESDWGTKAVSLHSLKAAVWALMFTEHDTVGDGPAGATPHVIALSQTWNRTTSSVPAVTISSVSFFLCAFDSRVHFHQLDAAWRVYCRMNKCSKNLFLIYSLTWKHILPLSHMEPSTLSLFSFFIFYFFCHTCILAEYVLFFSKSVSVVVSVIWSCIQALMPTYAPLNSLYPYFTNGATEALTH